MKHIIEAALNDHEVIGWDADSTLINGPYSELLCEYLLENPQKKHHIITFREAGPHAEGIWRDLKNYNVFKEHIETLNPCPLVLHESYGIHQLAEKYWKDYSESLGLTVEQMKKHAEAFPLWKAAVCQRLGCSILVDDYIHWTIDGCQMFNIRLLNSITLDMEH